VPDADSGFDDGKPREDRGEINIRHRGPGMFVGDYPDK
jgi:hypothetical protein